MEQNLSGVPRIKYSQCTHSPRIVGMTEVAILRKALRRCSFVATKCYRDMGRHAHLAPQRDGPCDRGPGTQGRVLRAMIEMNRAELSAVSVAIDGFATYGVPARPGCDFLDVFQV